MRSVPGPLRRLEALRRAHRSARARGDEQSHRREDYLEVIFELLEEKGYVRLVDVSAHLGVRGSTTTAMVKRLADEGLLTYEKYRGVALTARGRDVARFVRRRHGILHEFLRLLGEEEASAHRTVEGIEHHVGRETLERVEAFVLFARENPAWFRRYARRRSRR